MSSVSSQETEAEAETGFEGRLADITFNARDFPPWFKQKIQLWEVPPFAMSEGQRTSSTLGILDTLPNEVLDLIIKNLDFVSLSRLSEVSLKGKSLIRGLPAYRDLIKHANKVLFVLGKTKALSYHSISKIHATMRSEKCASCGAFSQFVNLLTFTRSCYWCLQHNPMIWLLPRRAVATFFELESSDLETLPTLHAILPVDNYGEDVQGLELKQDKEAQWKLTNRLETCKHVIREWAEDSLQVVSVGMAKELADRIHGPRNYSRRHFRYMKSITETGDEHEDRYVGCCADDNLESVFLNIAGSIMYDPRDPRWDRSGPPWTDLEGIGYVPFPVLSSSGTVEPRFYCGGCWRSFLRPPGNSPPGSPSVRMKWRRKFKNASGHTRIKAEMLSHFDECYGVQELLVADKLDWDLYCIMMDKPPPWLWQQDVV